MEIERKKGSMFLEASKCPWRSGCKHSHQNLERNPKHVLPNASSFVQQTAMKLPAECVFWRMCEIRWFLINQTEKIRYFRKEGRGGKGGKTIKLIKVWTESQKILELKVLNSSDIQTLCENASWSRIYLNNWTHGHSPAGVLPLCTNCMDFDLEINSIYV